MSHVVLDVRPTAAGEDLPAGLVVTVLTGHVESSEPGPVLHVDVGLAGAEERHGLAEPVVTGEMESSVPVQLVLVVNSCSCAQQDLDDLQVTPRRGQLQGASAHLNMFINISVWREVFTHVVQHVAVAAPVQESPHGLGMTGLGSEVENCLTNLERNIVR